MGWICGTTAPVTPRGGRSLWQDTTASHRVWVVDGGSLGCVRTCESVDARLAVVGDIWVSEDELRRALGDVRREAWRSLTRWPGSYWVIAQHRDRTVVVSDLSGARPVFRAGLRGETVWATEAKPLAALTDAGIDHEAIVHRLSTPALGGLVTRTTTFDGIRRVPGGRLLTVDGATTSTRSYEPVGQDTPLHDGAAAFRDALREAVGVRVRNTPGPVGADLARDANTTPLARITAGRTPLLDPADVSAAPPSGAQPLPFDRLEQAPVTDQPFDDAARWARLRARCVAAADAGETLQLVGTGRDLLLTAPVTALSDLATGGRRLALWRAAVTEARRRHLTTHDVYRAALRLARTSYGEALTDLAAHIAAPGAHAAGTIPWLAPTGVAAWLTPRARRSTSAVVRGLAERTHGLATGTSARRIWDEVHTAGPRFTGTATQGASAGCRLAAPFLDNEVIRAALAVPVHEHLSSHRRRPLLSAAMGGDVPEVPPGRPARGAERGAGRAGLTRNLAWVTDLLAGSELVAADLLDARAIAHDLHRAIGGDLTRLRALEMLIGTELWLAQHRRVPAESLWRTDVSARC